MCNFSNNNQSAKSIFDQQAQATAIMKKIAEECCAIKDSEKSGLYSSIPMSINIVIGDFNIFCNNEAYRRHVDSKQEKATAEPKATTAKSQTTEPQATAEPKATTAKSQQTTSNNTSASKTTDHLKFDELYSLITDFIGSYTRTKISIAPGCGGGVRLGFINKGVCVEKTEMPFFGVETISLQRHFSRIFDSFSIFPRGDAFSVTIKGDEVEVSKLMKRVHDNIVRNKREVEWARYNN